MASRRVCRQSDPNQLSLDFGGSYATPKQVLAPVSSHSAVPAPIEGELLEPTPARASRTPEYSLGEREHQRLSAITDKYEARMFLAMKAYVGSVLLAVCLHGGLPIVQAILEKEQLPPLPAQMLSAVFFFAATVFGCAMIYFYARLHSANIQLSLDLRKPRRPANWASVIANGLVAVWLFSLIAMYLVIFILSIDDAILLLRQVQWRMWPSPWDTLPPKS